MARKHDVHLSRDREHGGWKSTRGGERLSHNRTQAGATAAGKREAQHDGVELVIHGRDGRIRSKDSYGSDPIPPTDREH